MDKLQYLLDKQKDLFNTLANGRDWYKKSSVNDKLDLWTMAIIDECAEMRQGLNWKKWKNNKPLDLEYLREEVIDILHFLLDMCNLLGLDAHEIVRRYDEKHSENLERQVNGGKEKRKDYILQNRQQ